MLNKGSTYFLFLLVLLIAGCSSSSRTSTGGKEAKPQKTGKTSRTNLAFLYQPDKQFAKLDCAVFHTSDTISNLFVRVNFSDLIYEKDPFSGIYICSYRLTYKLKAGYDATEILATSTEISGDSINYGKNTGFIHMFQVPARYPGKYVIEVELFDLNRKAASRQFVNVWKTSRSGRQEFMVVNQNAQMIFRNYLVPGETFRILAGDPTVKALTVSYYNRDFPVARPPFTEDREPVFDHKPDSIFSLALNNGESPWLEFDLPGFYHFRKDTTTRDGLTLFVFPEGFPEIYSAEQLRAPLRYLTTRKEFDSLTASAQPKAAVDEFWLKTAGSPERAMVLIQKYYRNVEESNLYFTSYLEGWKTDRGMIYTVLGKPTYIYRSDDSEEWIFGEPQNRSSLRFTFIRVKNPFTDNDFMLLRSPTFKEPWFITVQSWRR